MYTIWNDRLGDYHRSRDKAHAGQPAVFATLEQALTKMEELLWLDERHHRVRVCNVHGMDIHVFDPK